jgi:rRNA-processing protein CGR1
MVSTPSPPAQSCRSNGPITGKNWHQPKRAFRPTSGLTSYAKRMEEQKNADAMKAKEKEMKEEKAAQRQVGPFRII